jgi:hypothetical protein
MQDMKVWCKRAREREREIFEHVSALQREVSQWERVFN